METITIVSQTLENLRKPDGKLRGLKVSKIKNNLHLIKLLGNKFYNASFVRASFTPENFNYVAWQLKRNQAHISGAQQLTETITLMRVGQSRRYYLINSESKDVLAIQN